MKLCKIELLNSLQQMDCSLRLHSSTLVLPSICPSHGYSECSGTKIKWEKYRYRREKRFSNSLIKWLFFIIQGSAKLGRVVDRQRKWLLHFPSFCSSVWRYIKAFFTWRYKDLKITLGIEFTSKKIGKALVITLNCFQQPVFCFSPTSSPFWWTLSWRRTLSF